MHLFKSALHYTDYTKYYKLISYTFLKRSSDNSQT